MKNVMSEENGRADDKFYRFAKGKGVMNLPNILTLSRMVMIPLFALFFYLEFTAHYFVALAVFALAAFTDLLDGKIARKYNLVTNLGKFLDPIADKALVATAFILMLTRPGSFLFGLGDWAIIAAGCGVAVIIVREIIVSGFRMVAADAGVVIAADIFGKYKTVMQDLAVAVLLAGAGIAGFTDGMAADIVNCVGLALFAVAVLLTIASGINYIVRNVGVLKR